MAPVRSASADISVKIVVPKPARRVAVIAAAGYLHRGSRDAAAPPYIFAATSTSEGAGTQASSDIVGWLWASEGAQRVSNARGDITLQSWPLRWCRPITWPSSCAATQTESGRGGPPRLSRRITTFLPCGARPIDVL